jgi:ribosomal protein RSM22 (predicted rRNA methylase)
MKSVLTAFVLGLALSATARAQMADQMITVLKCTNKVVVPDNGLQVVVEEGGIAGLTQIKVTRFFLGRMSEKTYIAKLVPPVPHRLGAPMVYEGKDITLSVNFTTAPLENFGHIGYLETADSSQEALNCQALAHTL